MIGMCENKITRVPLVEAVKMVWSNSFLVDTVVLTESQTKSVAEAIEEKKFEKAMELRDPEFKEGLENFVATSSLDSSHKLPKAKVGLGSSRMLHIY